MNKFEKSIVRAIETTCANNGQRRKQIYDKARLALNEWYVENLAPTNERMDELMQLESAIELVEERLKWMQVAE